MMLEHLPLVIGCVFMAIAGICELTLKRVPNAINGISLLGAIVVSGLCQAGVLPSSGGGLGASFIGLMIGLLLLIPFYAKGLLGAGCVKAQAVFGAWLGAAFGSQMTLKIALFAGVTGIVVTFICILPMLLRLKWEPDAEEFSSRDRRRALFPAQVTLAFGAILAVFLKV